MKKICVLLILSSIFTSAIFAQTDSVAVAQSDTTTSPTVLKNFFSYYINQNKNARKVYFDLGIGFGFILGDIKNSNADLIYGKSWVLDEDIRIRYYFSKRHALIFDAKFMYNFFAISNGVQNNILPSPPAIVDNYVLNKEYYVAIGMGLMAGYRFNFDKNRKTYRSTGKYIELGIYGIWNANPYYELSYKSINDISATVMYENPSIFNAFDVGAQVTLGWNWFNIYGRYRFTDCFTSKSIKAQLPPFSLGFGLTLY